VKFFGASYRNLRRTIFTATNIPALIALVVVAVLGLFADHQNKLISRAALRADVLAQVSVVRAKLEGNINSNIQLVRGLVATLATEPEMDQARFDQLAATLFTEQSQLRNIAVAPDLVVSLIYPMAGNEQAIGLDLSTDPVQREAAVRARDTGEFVLAGPVDLGQEGSGFIGRFPVFVTRFGYEKTFWGIVSAVVDADKLFRDSGLLDPALPIDISITGKDALGDAGERFFGNQKVAENRPVVADVLLPSGSWQIAAVPKGGWDVTPANAWLFRTIMIIAGALVVVPIVIAGRLVEERQKHYRQLRRSERQLSRLSRRLELALEASKIGVWEHNLETNELLWDDRVNELYGKPTDGKVRQFFDWIGGVHPDDAEQAQRDFDEAVANRGPYSSEYRVVLPDGAIRHIRTRAIVYQDGNEAPKMIGAEWDVSADVALRKDLERAKILAETRNIQLEAARARIEHIALHDSLTGLPNRRYLDEMLERHVPAEGESNGIALLQIDLDRFKEINDTLGHAAGDAMLVHAAKVLKANIRKGDFVARIGGDEFVVVCTSDGSAERMASLADRIIRRTQKPVFYQGNECRFGVSVGISSEAGKRIDPKRLLINADIALYRAKSRGRNRYEFFTETLQEEVVNSKRLADEILHGLESNEFLAHYQPQFDARTLQIVGVEALARWQHPVHGMLLPEAFLRTAEELNVVSTIDQLLLNQALRQFDVWNASGLAIPRVSVNVSAKRLQDEELIASIRDLNIRPGTVSFELVESIFLDENDDLVAANIDQIKALGIEIEIDDFGTGYASIVSLLKLKPRRLKIDRQLVMPIVKSEAQKHLVGSIIDIGKSLGIEVIAEGVETMDHARILKELGCDILQGYAFAAAMPMEEFHQFARTRVRLVAS
jgi:diguanylate cyclase (GGDEF)-like protein